MPTQVLWTFHNVGSEMLPGLKGNCDIDGGHMLTEQSPDGRLTAACIVLSPVAPAVGATVNPSSGVIPASASSDIFPNVLVASAMQADSVAAGIESPQASAASAAISPQNLDRRLTDLTYLHPIVRGKIIKLQEALDAEGIPMKLFEAFRTPQRQAYLYAKGRTTGGSKVTNANAWESYHQYGLAADFVRFEEGKWNWNDRTPNESKQWDRFHEIARENGLEPLSWERPHVQIMGVTLTELRNGAYPDGGDESWASNLAKAIADWRGSGAPPLPDEAQRPAMQSPSVILSLGASGSEMKWHSMFGGDAWAYDRKGVYTRDHEGKLKLWRTVGAPITVQEILTKHGSAIAAASAKHGAPPELIVMTIATEAGQYRTDDFTGPKTFRWEQGYTVGATGDNSLDGKEKGDYSAGPMQVLSDTARWMNNLMSLGYNNAKDFKFFKDRPANVPSDLGLYDSAICIDIGAAYIKHNFGKTGDDPLLVAAVYNSGGLYPSMENHWRIKSYGNHIDRAAEWYGDACFVLSG